MISLALIFCTFVACTHGFRSVCYFSNTAQYRGQLGSYKPENIDPMLCTHVVYSYARIYDLDLQPTEWNDDNSDMGSGMYTKVLNLRSVNSDLKVLLSIGNLRKTPDPYLSAIQTESSRSTFADYVVEYLRNRTFDGVVLEWSSLVAKDSPLFDKDRFLLLLQKIREKSEADSQRTGKSTLILAVTMPAKKQEIDKYPVAEIVAAADFISVRAFDLRTAEDKVVGLSSPFLADPKASGDDKYLSFKWIVDYYESMGIPKDKVNLGISTYGRSFQLKSEKENTVGSPAVDYGNIGPWSATVGVLGHYELCQFIWTNGAVFNVPEQGGRYYTSGTSWVSYEDTLSVSQKACYIKDKGFGGITFWTLDLDDFSGNGCREGKYPIISTAIQVMTSTDPNTCNLMNSTSYVEALTKDRENSARPALPSTVGEKMRMICYYESWAFFRRGKGLFVPENINPLICTHIIYTYAVVENYKIVPYIRKEVSEPWREGLFDRLIKTKEVNPALKVLISIGGGAGSTFIDNLPSDSETLKTLATNVLSFLKSKGFDGLEITWEVPTFELKRKFLDLLEVMKMTFDEDAAASGKPRLILTVALPAGKGKIDEIGGHDLKTVEAATDFISVRTYDFHGSWEKHTGFNAPIYDAPYESGDNVFLNLHWVSRYLFSLGLAKENLNLGIPTYGRSYTLQNAGNNGVYAAVTGPGTAGDFTGTQGFLAFYEVCDLISHGSNIVQVPPQRTVYTFQDTLWVSYDDPSSVGEKACYAARLGFGGVNVWSLDLDDFLGVSCELGKYPLVTTIYNITQRIGSNNKCNNFRVMESRSGANRQLACQHLISLSLMTLSILGVYLAKY